MMVKLRKIIIPRETPAFTEFPLLAMCKTELIYTGKDHQKDEDFTLYLIILHQEIPSINII
jgi:hypothetical protein